MNNVTLPEEPVAKKKPERKPKQPEGDEPLGGERIEFQAPPGFTAKIDSHAKALGMGRSAYIRMACNKLMAQQDKDDL